MTSPVIMQITRRSWALRAVAKVGGSVDGNDCGCLGGWVVGCVTDDGGWLSGRGLGR